MKESTTSMLRWSCEAEQAVLGALLTEPRAWKRAGDSLIPGQFYDPRHGAIFTVIAALANAGQAVDVVSVFERMQAEGKAETCGGIVYLNELAQSSVGAGNVVRHAEIVREKSAQRDLAAAIADAAEIVAGNDSVGTKLDNIAALLAPLERKQTRQAPRRIAEIAAERTVYYQQLAEGTAIAGWPTRIPRLDRMLNGGLRAGGLYILAARPSVGKSSFSQAIGLQLAADGLPTLFLSQEMGEGEVADRAVSNAGRVDYAALLSGRMGDEDWTRAADALEHLIPVPFFVDDQPALTLRDLKAKARSIDGLKVLVLDYLQLCSSDQTESNRNTQIEQISRGLKAFAKEAGIAVIALSQLNRKVEDRANKRPNLGDLRDSGAIEQDADVVLFLWPVRENGEHRIVGLGVDKNRQGRTGEFGLDFHGATQRWTESTADINPPAKTGGRSFD